MKKYRVYLSAEVPPYIDVKAWSEREAEDKAMEEWADELYPRLEVTFIAREY